MDVHHHPHVEKKGFREYLLEFLMIFLAVTLGFIAENIREETTAHKRAKVFAQSMREDLAGDTAQLHNYHNYFANAADDIDTFMQLLSANAIDQVPSGKLYWYGLFGGARASFVRNDATFEQIKSSGSLGLFKQKTASDLEKYDRFCRVLQGFDEINQDIYAEVRKARALIFDFRYNEIANQLYQKNRDVADRREIESFMSSNPPLLSRDRILFNEYVELVRSRFLRSYYVATSDSLSQQAGIVLKDLENDYR